MKLRFTVFVLLLFLATPVVCKTPIMGFVSLKLSQDTLKQGTLLRVDVTTPVSLITANIQFLSINYPLLLASESPTENQRYSAFIGISDQMPTGQHTLTCQLVFSDKNRFELKDSVKILASEWAVSHVKLPPKSRQIARNTRQLQKEADLITQIFQEVSSPFFISTPFTQPAEGQITTPFGARRSYNHNYYTSKHSGLDIANKLGTPVHAANDGIVVFSESLKSNGDTIIIDHGLGIHTVYTHLHRRLVKKNDRVAQGQKIGTIGQTGIAAGTHLHWGFSVHNTRIDPAFVLENPAIF